MRNFVAKNDYNRASTHKSARDYTRLSKHELLEESMDAWEDLDDVGLLEDYIPLKDPKQWESNKETTLC
ncbi:hypothetical protein NVX19_003531 [Salmonella enterica]|nr:hypothetical protein [Salmonella enterica]